MNGKGRLALGGAAIVLLVTVALAAAYLPDRVEVYYTPTDRPDVVYERWQYLVLVTAITPVMALAGAWIGSTVHSLVVLFVADSPVVGTHAGGNVGVWVAAWMVLWSAGAVWLVVGLGNEPVTRSWWELVLVLAGFVVTVSIIGGHARHAARRAGRGKKQQARGAR